MILRNNILPFYFCVAGLFLIIVSPNLLSEGMFMDGLYYATISKNLANGIGSFWNPHYTNIIFPSFQEHPPLAFWLESMFFHLLGDGRFTERVYSIVMLIVAAFIIMKIWKALKPESSYSWLPLLFWLSIPVVGWGYCNNMLENTLSVFIALSALLYIKYYKKNSLLHLCLVGIALFLGFLTKGFVAFFPWVLPFSFWLFSRNVKFIRMCGDTLLIMLFTLLPLFLLIITIPEAKDYFSKYITDKVLFEMNNGVHEGSRHYVLKQLIMEFLPVLIIGAVIFIIGWYKKKLNQITRPDIKMSFIFYFIGLAGVLPIMISEKQSGFYLIPAFLFFAIATAILLLPLIDSFLRKINYQSKGFLVFKIIGYIILFTGITLCSYNAFQLGRNQVMIKDTHTILSKIPANATINICKSLEYNWSIHAYFGRYKNVSLDSDIGNRHDFILIENSSSKEEIRRDNKLVDLETTDYNLYKREVKSGTMQ